MVIEKQKTHKTYDSKIADINPDFSIIKINQSNTENKSIQQQRLAECVKKHPTRDTGWWSR